MTVPEVIAKLDALERMMLVVVQEVREVRYELFETLDNHDEPVVD